MKNPFKRDGFDTLVSKNTTIADGSITIGGGESFILDGNFIGERVAQGGEHKVDQTTLVVNGLLKVNSVNVSNLTVTGKVECDLLIVEGVLAIKAGGEIRARVVRYRSLMIETGAVVMAQMEHLDHVSAGEQT